MNIFLKTDLKRRIVFEDIRKNLLLELDQQLFNLLTHHYGKSLWNRETSFKEHFLSPRQKLSHIKFKFL